MIGFLVNIFGLEFSTIQIIICALVLIVLIAFIAHIVNGYIQLKAALLIDVESRVYNRDGLLKYLKKHKKIARNSSYATINLKNLDRLYDYYPDKSYLLFLIANIILEGLAKKDVVARVDFDTFLVVLYKKDIEDGKKVLSELTKKLNNSDIKDYGFYTFDSTLSLVAYDQLKDVFEEKKLKFKAELLEMVDTAITLPLYSKVQEDGIYLYTEYVYAFKNKIENVLYSGDIALRKRQFTSYYCPIISSQSGHVVGAYLVPKWLDENTNMPINEDIDFLKIFYNRPYSQEIDLINFENACNFLKENSHILPHGFTLYLNISAFSFQSYRFLERLNQILLQTQINKNSIVILLSDVGKYLNEELFSALVNQAKGLSLNVGYQNYGRGRISVNDLYQLHFNTVSLASSLLSRNLESDVDFHIYACLSTIVDQFGSHILMTGVNSHEPLKRIMNFIEYEVFFMGEYFSKELDSRAMINFLSRTYDFGQYIVPKEEVVPVSAANQIDSLVEIDDSYDEEFDMLRGQIDELKNLLANQDDKKDEVHLKEIETLREQIKTLEVRNQQPQYPQQQYVNPFQAPYVNFYGQPYNPYERELYELRRQLDDLRSENRDLRNRPQSSNDGLNDIRSQLEALKNANHENQLERKNDEIRAIKAELDRLRSSDEEKKDKADYAALQAQIDELRNSKSEVQVTANPEPNNTQADYAALQAQIDELNSKVAADRQAASEVVNEDAKAGYATLQAQIDELKNNQVETAQAASESRSSELDEIRMQLQEIMERQKSNQIDVEELVKRLKSEQLDSTTTIAKPEIKAEEIENMLEDIKEDSTTESVKPTLVTPEKINLDIEALGDDDDDDDDDDSDEEEVLEKPTLTLEEVEAIIQSYKDKYFAEWNQKAQEELKDGYYEVINGLRYYRGRVKKNLPERIKDATPELKNLYNIVKNEFLQYNDVKSRITNRFDMILHNNHAIAKINLTKKRVRVYLNLNPKDYSETQFPHRDVSNKKVHVKTPFLMFVRSKLSAKRMRMLVADLMLNYNLRPDTEYQAKDYANAFKFYKRTAPKK